MKGIEIWECTECGMPCRVEVEFDKALIVSGDRFVGMCICRESTPYWRKTDYTWRDVIKECERILGCDDTAESPLMSDLPNLIRDLKRKANIVIEDRREAATLAEREACAVLAWSTGMDDHQESNGALRDARTVGSIIAQRIRDRSTIY